MTTPRRASRGDAIFHYNLDPGQRVSVAKRLVNPSLLAARLFRLAASEAKAPHLIGRWLCIFLFSSDVSRGARFEGPIDLPHPVGITIGTGAIVGPRVRIYQNVTIGSSRAGLYPRIGEGVTIYSNAVVAGGLTVGDGAVIGANCTVTQNVPERSVVRSLPLA